MAYLKSLPPVNNKVLGPYSASQTPAAPYISVIIPTAEYMALRGQNSLWSGPCSKSNALIAGGRKLTRDALFRPVA